MKYVWNVDLEFNIDESIIALLNFILSSITLSSRELATYNMKKIFNKNIRISLLAFTNNQNTRLIFLYEENIKNFFYFI